MLERKVSRCGVNLKGVRYVSPDLVEHHNQIVQVEFIAATPDWVRVLDQQGEQVCLARRVDA